MTSERRGTIAQEERPDERGAARAQKEGASSVYDEPRARSEVGAIKTGAFQETGHRARILSSYNYDLVEELSELLTGAWRIDAYLKDAGGQCDECGRIWQDVRKQKEFLIEKIRQEITNHAKEGRFV